MAINRISLQKILPSIQDGATVLVPNLRIKDAILSQYLASIESGTAATPGIIPIDVFIKQHWDLCARHAIEPCCNFQLLSANEEFLLWNEIVEASLDKIPLLNPDETANAVAQSYQLARQWLEPKLFTQELAAHSGITDVAVFSQWIANFQKHCADLQLISLVDAITEFTKLLKNGTPGSFPDNVVLVNFYDPPPLYKALFDSLPATEQILTINHESDTSKLSKIRYEFDTPKIELAHCANWVRDTLAQEPEAHIGIISSNKESERLNLELALRDALNPDLYFSNRQDHSLFNSTTSANRLVDFPVIHDALLVLGLGKEQHAIEDLVRVLQSPFLTTEENSDDEVNESQARINLADYLRQRSQATISNRELSYLAENIERPYHCKIFATQLVQLRTEIRKLNKSATTTQWSQLFSRLLLIAGWPNPDSSVYQRRILRQWQTLLSQFSKTSTILSALDFNAALTKLRLLCSQVKVSNQFDASLPVSFYSVTESIGLEFDHIWLLGFNDQSCPESVNPSPFIPYATQKAAGIPGSHSDIQLSHGQKLFTQIVEATKTSVQASFFASDGEQQYRASSFIHDFENGFLAEQEITALSQNANRHLNSIPIELVADQSLALGDDEVVKGGASLVTDQSCCPFRAFAKHRLQIEPSSAIETGLTKMARGTAIHIALEHFYENINQSDELASKDFTQSIDDSTAAAIEYLNRRYRDIMTPRFQQIEQQRLASLLRKFIELEKKRPAFQIIAREHSISQRFDNLMLNIRIDRIDRLENDATALLDYKTGKYTASPRNWLEERPEDMQLPLYHTLANSNELDNVDAVAIAHINAEKIAYSGVAATDSFATEIKPLEQQKWSELDWRQATEFWSEKVQQFTAEFNMGKAVVNPIDTNKTCTYCGLQALCRIQEQTDSDVFATEDSGE